MSCHKTMNWVWKYIFNYIRDLGNIFEWREMKLFSPFLRGLHFVQVMFNDQMYAEWKKINWEWKARSAAVTLLKKWKWMKIGLTCEWVYGEIFVGLNHRLTLHFKGATRRWPCRFRLLEAYLECISISSRAVLWNAANRISTVAAQLQHYVLF